MWWILFHNTLWHICVVFVRYFRWSFWWIFAAVCKIFWQHFVVVFHSILWHIYLRISLWDIFATDFHNCLWHFSTTTCSGSSQQQFTAYLHSSLWGILSGILTSIFAAVGEIFSQQLVVDFHSSLWWVCNWHIFQTSMLIITWLIMWYDPQRSRTRNTAYTGK